MKKVIIDMQNFFYKAFHGIKASNKRSRNYEIAVSNLDKNDIIKGDGIEMDVNGVVEVVLKNMNAMFHEYYPCQLVCAFDGHKNWRKHYTKRGCITHKVYKANRRKNLSDLEEQEFEAMDAVISEFRKILKDNTKLEILYHPNLEADDVIAEYIRQDDSNERILFSSDKDLLQLLKYGNLTIFDAKGNQNDLADYGDNVDLFLREKFFRGDIGDNVQSSYPRLRTKKIKESMEDEYLFQNLLNHEFDVEYIDQKSGEVKHKKYLCKDIFEENITLMDLEKQPEGILKIMKTVVQEEVVREKKYNMFPIMKFLKQKELYDMLKSFSQYSEMLSGNMKPSKVKNGEVEISDAFSF